MPQMSPKMPQMTPEMPEMTPKMPKGALKLTKRPQLENMIATQNLLVVFYTMTLGPWAPVAPGALALAPWAPGPLGFHVLTPKNRCFGQKITR